MYRIIFAIISLYSYQALAIEPLYLFQSQGAVIDGNAEYHLQTYTDFSDIVRFRISL
jgi:hypothetical protein